jgi:hypothetical protein
MPVGRWEVRKLIEIGLKEDLLKYFRKIMEEILSRIEAEREGRGTVTQVIAIFDMEQLWFSKLASMESELNIYYLFKHFLADDLHFTAFISSPSNRDPILSRI